MNKVIKKSKNKIINEKIINLTIIIKIIKIIKQKYYKF